MASMICLPLNHPFADGNPIRKAIMERPYIDSSYKWYIIAKGNIIEGIEAKE